MRFIMAKIMESAFDIVYLILVVLLGIKMIKNSEKKSQYRLFGIMAVVLGAGDAFHLIPRVYAMWSGGLEAHTKALGTGQMITSVTMTIFYIILYEIYRKRYQIQGQKMLSGVIYLLAAVRIILCLFPQNRWTSADAPLSWGIYRNIPFALLGIIIIIIFYQKAKQTKDSYFRFMWLAVVLSFGFYAPVVLFVHKIPMLGMLMIPKTCAYVWVVFMGYQAMRAEK